jgi:hypothetical protein
MQQLLTESSKTKVTSGNISVTVPDSIFKIFFFEVSSLTIFTLRFFNEVFKPPFAFSELMKQSFLIGYKSLGLVGITGFLIGLVLTIQSRPTLVKNLVLCRYCPPWWQFRSYEKLDQQLLRKSLPEKLDRELGQSWHR